MGTKKGGKEKKDKDAFAENPEGCRVLETGWRSWGVQGG